jgi:membrane carboxypeptidase/penicillin-binding protein PbpC
MVASIKPLVDNLNKQVAVKTGTTDDYRDVWVEGYTPNVVVGAWAGKNDNTPMDRKVAGLVITPVWGAFMAEINDSFPKEYFKKPDPSTEDLKPVLRGNWKGGISYKIDSISGKLATQYTPQELQQEIVFNNVHTILNWVNKDDPRGDIPKDPKQDSQYEYWEYGVRKWFEQYQKDNPLFKETTVFSIPTETDNIHIPENFPKITITNPKSDTVVNSNTRVNIEISSTGSKYPLKKSELYVNDRYILTNDRNPNSLSFVPEDVDGIQGKNIIKVISYDTVLNRAEATVDLMVQ